MQRKKTLALAATAVSGSLVLAACGGGPSAAGGKISDDKVVLGLLNDQSGVYKDLSGPNSKVAIEMAIADYKAKYGDKAVAKTIEVVQADHQNKPDIANTKAQEMYDREKADIILDVPTSSAALAVANQAKAKKKLFIDIGAGTTALTGASCNKYTFHWAYNTAMLAAGMIMLVMFLAALAGSPTVVHNDTGRRAAFASGVPDVAAVQVSPSSTTSPSTPSAADAMSETPNARPASTPIVSSTSPTQ